MHSDVEKNDLKKPLYYLENGLVVFTEAFHLDRGYCCGNNCRHCPWPKTTSGKAGQKKIK